MRTLLMSAFAALFVAGAALAHSHQADGQVVKIDKPAGRITVKHGPIKTLDMDAMTMVFRVADPAMLDKVKAGDRVRFEAGRVNGAITITAMEAVK